MMRKTCAGADGLTLVYSAAGTGETCLVFIHGGLADRSFFDHQVEALSGRRRVIALDLAGHGESGRGRTVWGVHQFGSDVRAAVEAENAERVFLFGNSLGGAVALEAALQLSDRVEAVVGIDTFQDLGHPETEEYARAAAEEVRRRAEAFRSDFPGAVRSMARMLFHADADPARLAWAEQRMLRTSPEVAFAILSSLAGYDPNRAARKLTVPLRAINGDLFPTDLARIRSVKPDFDAVIMPHTGHYPMLERPKQFEDHVLRVVRELEQHR